MKSLKTRLFVTALLLCFGAKAQQPYSGNLTETDVRKVTTSVMRWQMAHFDKMNDIRVHKQSDLTWANGVFLGALAEWADFAGDKEGIKFCREVAKRNYNQPAPNRMYHADDIIVSMMYAALYAQDPKPNIIQPTIARLDFQVNYPATVSLVFGTPNAQDRWNWCDALYMAPPVFMRFAKITGNQRYIDHADSEFWATTDFLYDPSEKLFYRDSRYFDQREANGKKIFWGRGNGWVVGGLAWILEYLPKEHPSRPRYEALLKDMCAKLVSLQDHDGYWHPSLLDPESYHMPETSGTGLNIFALWWGINHKILDAEKYMPAAEKGWKALVRAVDAEGKLGWVQPIGADPKVTTADMTEVYGAGAMMLAAKQVMLYLQGNQ